LTKFGHVNFTITEKYSKIIYENPNYYASLVIFQKYKMQFTWVALLIMFFPVGDVRIKTTTITSGSRETIIDN